MKKRSLRLIQLGLFALIVAGVFWLLRDVDFAETWPVIRQMNFALLAAVFLLGAANIGLYAARWFVLLSATARHVAFKNVLIATISAIAINTSGPGKLGVPAKAFLIKKLEGFEVSRTLPSIMVELMLEIGSLFILMIVFALPLGLHGMVFDALRSSLTLESSVLLLIVAAGAGITAYFLRHKIRAVGFLTKMFSALRATVTHKTAFSIALVLSLANLMLSFWGDQLLFRALHQGIPYTFIAFSSAFTTVAGLFSPMPGGLGVWELSRAFLFKTYYNIGEIAVVMTLLRRVMTYLALGIIHILNATLWARYAGEGVVPDESMRELEETVVS